MENLVMSGIIVYLKIVGYVTAVGCGVFVLGLVVNETVRLLSRFRIDMDY